MPTVASLVAEVKVQGADTAKQQLSNVGQAAKETQSGFGDMLKSALATAGGFALFNVGAKAVGFLKDQVVGSLDAAMKHQQVMSQTSQVIKSTGDASGLSAQQISDLAESLSKTTTFSQDTIQSGQNLLLTFTGIGKDVFPATTQTMLDMAQAMHMGPEQAAMQLGKALNDPAKGLTALTREGVTFSDAEKASIKTMLAHNDVAGAQKIMLKELQTEFGGSAKAAGQTFGGSLQILQNNLDNVKIKIGTALLPILGQLTGFVSSTVMPAIGKFSDFLSSPAFQKFASDVGKNIINIFTGIGNVLKSVDWGTFGKDFSYLGQQLGSIVSGIKPPSTNLFDVIGPVVKNIVGDIGNFAKDLGDAVKFLKDGGVPSQILRDALAGIAVAITAIKIGEFVSAIPKLVAGFQLWAAGAWEAAAGTIAATWPILAIGAVIAVVVAGIILAIQHWGEISKWLQSAWSNVSKFFEGIWHDIQGFFGGVGKWFQDRFNEAKTGVSNAFGSIGQWFQDRWKDIQNVFAGIGKWFGDRWNEIYAPLKPVVDFIAAVFQTLWNIIVAVMGKIGKWFQDRWNEISAVFAPIGKWFQDRFNEAWQNIVAIFTPVGKWFGDRWKDIQNVFSGVGGWFHDRFTEAHNGVQTAWGNTSNWFQDRWKDIQNTFSPVGKWFQDRFTEAWQNIVTIFTPIGHWFQDRWNDIVNDVITLKNNIVDKFNDIKTSVLNTFHNFVNGIIDKLNDGISSIEGFINLFGQGLDSIAKSLGTQGNIPKVTLGRIPHYASGTDSHPGGPAIVGERGRELVWLPTGAKVAPNSITEALLSMGGRIPGYADGIGDLGSKILGWIGGGAKSILDNVLTALHISTPTIAGMGNIASALFSKVKDWAVGWIGNLLPKFNAGPGGTPVDIPGNLQSWIAQAIGATGAPASWAADLGIIAMHESGGNPNVQNNWDINAQNGDPSRGLFQTIGATFRAYALPGHGNILNPVDNAIAAIRYIMSRYGDVFHVPGIASMAQGGPYVGYANGGTVNADGTYMVGERGPEAVYLPRGANVISNSQLRSAQAPQPVTIVVNLAGRNVGEILLPDITQAIRYSVGTHGM